MVTITFGLGMEDEQDRHGLKLLATVASLKMDSFMVMNDTCHPSLKVQSQHAVSQCTRLSIMMNCHVIAFVHPSINLHLSSLLGDLV